MKDRKIYTLNKISPVGTKHFREGYTLVDTIDDAAGVLVRSQDMHGMEFPASLRAIARAGAGVNNIPIEECAEQGIVVFNTPGANANSVKELVVAALMMSSRGIIDGAHWVRDNADDENISKSTEKAKKAFAGNEINGKVEQDSFWFKVVVTKGDDPYAVAPFDSEGVTYVKVEPGKNVVLGGIPVGCSYTVTEVTDTTDPDHPMPAGYVPYSGDTSPKTGTITANNNDSVK